MDYKNKTSSKEEDDIGKKKIEIMLTHTESGVDETCQTFIIHDEDHTLGNSLKFFVLQNPDVEFCGYNLPHPSENKIQFRIQTKESPAIDALKKGLVDLYSACDHVKSKFEAAHKCTFLNEKQRIFYAENVMVLPSSANQKLRLCSYSTGQNDSILSITP